MQSHLQFRSSLLPMCLEAGQQLMVLVETQMEFLAPRPGPALAVAGD